MPEAHYTTAVDTQEHDENSVLNSYRHFSAWRKGFEAILYGDIEFIETPEPILAFKRSYNGLTLLVCFNLSNEAQTISLEQLGVSELSLITDHKLVTATINDNNLEMPAFASVYAKLS